MHANISGFVACLINRWVPGTLSIPQKCRQKRREYGVAPPSQHIHKLVILEQKQGSLNNLDVVSTNASQNLVPTR